MPPQYGLDGSPEGSSTESKERMPRMDAERMSTLADLIAHGRMRQTVRGHRHSNMCLRTEAEIRAEADKLLSSGLRETLESYGKVHIVGSYRMRLMAWRDLDVHLVRETIDKTAFFTLGGRVASLLSPQRMHFRDETVAATPGLPSGLYWGVYLGDERKGAWKIDIWATGPAGLGRVRSYCDAIARRLSSSSRETILQIKSECWQHPEYRRAFSSADIYTAVLEHGIEDVDEFWTFLERQGRVTCV